MCEYKDGVSYTLNNSIINKLMARIEMIKRVIIKEFDKQAELSLQK